MRSYRPGHLEQGLVGSKHSINTNDRGFPKGSETGPQAIQIRH